MAERRGTGEGAVYRRGTTGAWHATVDLGRDASGKRVRKTVTGKTKREVLAKMAEVKSRQAAGVPLTDDRQTTGSYLAYWLDDVLPGTVKDSTEASYRWVVTRYLVPNVGATPLAKLTPSDVQSMMRRLERDGLSPRTRQYARAILRRALGQAVKEDRVRRNAAALVDSPKGAGTKLDDAMTADEARLVLEAAKGDRLEALAVLALSLGLRRGELLGLRWDDIDFEAATLTIARTLSRISGTGLVLSTPKTVNAARTIPLVGRARDALEGHLQRQAEERRIAGAAWVESGHVFTTPVGTLLDPANAYHWWRRLTDRSGVGARRLHASRHTCATLLLDQGVPLEVVSAVLGHAGLAITADIYARPTMDAKRRGLAAIADALGDG